MAVNSMTFEDAATVLSAIHQQATGQTALTATSTAAFITVAQNTMNAGLDKVYNALANVFGRTFMNQRPYSAKFRGLEYTEAEWGAISRKLSFAEDEPQSDAAYKWPVLYDSTQTVPSGNGSSVDQFKIHKPDIQETQFTGFDVYSDSVTIFREQLKTAFSGPDAFMSFLDGMMQHYENKHESYLEDFKRMTMCNYIAALADEADSTRNIKLITEYNTRAGLTSTDALDINSIYLPENYGPFMRFVYSRIATLSDMFEYRSSMFQTKINGKIINNHTPANQQRIYLLASDRYSAEMEVFADTFHDNYLKKADVETVGFWQSIKSPSSVNCLPCYTDTDGTVTSASAAISKSTVFGFIADKAALGVAELDRHADMSPYNASGMYQNMFWHSKLRCVNDLTEKGVLLLLE